MKKCYQNKSYLALNFVNRINWFVLKYINGTRPGQKKEKIAVKVANLWKIWLFLLERIWLPWYSVFTCLSAVKTVKKWSYFIQFYKMVKKSGFESAPRQIETEQNCKIFAYLEWESKGDCLTMSSEDSVR